MATDMVTPLGEDEFYLIPRNGPMGFNDPVLSKDRDWAVQWFLRGLNIRRGRFVESPCPIYDNGK